MPLPTPLMIFRLILGRRGKARHSFLFKFTPKECIFATKQGPQPLNRLPNVSLTIITEPVIANTSVKERLCTLDIHIDGLIEGLNSLSVKTLGHIAPPFFKKIHNVEIQV